jgi:hypothetical protein
MKDKNNIDSIIREKLEGFSASPPTHIWKNVQAQLAAQRRKTRRIYIGWISTAAAILLAFLAGWYFNENSVPKENMKATNEIIQPEKKVTETELQTSEMASQTTIDKSANKTNETISTEKSGLLAALTVSSNVKSNDTGKIDNINYSREPIIISRLESVDARVAQKQLLFEKLAVKTESAPANYLSENEKYIIAENLKTIKSSAKPDNNWKMGMYVSPGYSSYNANHSESYSKDITYSGSEGNSNVSGGFSVQYKTSKRWIVESGVYYAKNGQESENPTRLFAQNLDVMYAPASGETSYFSNSVRVENNALAMNSTAGVIKFSDTPVGAEISSDFEALKSNEGNIMVSNGSFSQVFQFMEIPLFVRYRLVDSKFGVELITGLNAGIVVGNDAYIDNQYGLQNIGETQDISTVNVSGTVGVGLNYALSKHFAVAIEPRFNYYLNSINTSSLVDFRPYRIGFYTGVSYEF